MPGPVDHEVNTLATLSVVFAFVLAPVGALLGHLGLGQIARTGQRGRERALVGITLSYAFIVIAIVALVAWAGLRDNTIHPAATTGAAASPTAVTPTATPAPAPLPSAASLLLPDGATTPAGTAQRIPLGDNYFTSAQPPNCGAAVLFRNSPLVPAGSTDHAESGYNLGDNDLMAESVDIYRTPLDPGALITKGFSAVGDCSGDAVGVNAKGESMSMRLTQFSNGDGILVWTMIHGTWICSHGLAVTTHAVLELSRCAYADFPMTDWANTRRGQIATHTS
jgi:hypothetical protein